MKKITILSDNATYTIRDCEILSRSSEFIEYRINDGTEGILYPGLHAVIIEDQKEK